MNWKHPQKHIKKSQEVSGTSQSDVNQCFSNKFRM